MACAIRPSNVRVYQFHHFRVQEAISYFFGWSGAGVPELGCGVGLAAGAPGCAAGFVVDGCVVCPGAGTDAGALSLIPLAADRGPPTPTINRNVIIMKAIAAPTVTFCRIVVVPRGPKVVAPPPPNNAAASALPD